MTDEDASLRRLFSQAAEAPEDDAFLAQVEQQIRRARRARRWTAAAITLALAVCLAAATPALLGVGLQITRGVELASREVTSVVLSPFGMLLGMVLGLTYLVARRR